MDDGISDDSYSLILFCLVWIIFTLDMCHFNKNSWKTKEEQISYRRISGCKTLAESILWSFYPRERFLRYGRRKFWQQGQVCECGNDKCLWKGVGGEWNPSKWPWKERKRWPFISVYFLGCNNMVVSIIACVHVSFLICYGNMWFLFFYLCSFQSLRPGCQVELGTHPLIPAAQVITLCHDWLEKGCGEPTRNWLHCPTVFQNQTQRNKLPNGTQN